MKKKLDEAAITNELRESLHFQRPQDQETAPEQEREAPEAVASTAPAGATREARVAITERPSVRPSVRVEQRILKRHPFEFYRDQLDALKQLSLSDQMAGGRGNMSEMVREALDAYLAKRKAGEGT